MKKNNDMTASFNGCKILITGGAGFIGSNLVKMLLAANTKVSLVVVDNLLSAEAFNIPQDRRLTFIQDSITANDVLKKIDDSFDYVFHLATFHGNQNSIFDPLQDHENNTLTTLKLLNHIKNHKNIKKIVYSSAGCAVAKKTFSKAKATPEEAPIFLTQDSPYSISKIVGEFYCAYFTKQFALPTVRARFQNVYGPGEILGAGQWRGTIATVWRNVVPNFVYTALKNKPLRLENKGIATRDFIFVDDICRGLIACAVKGNTGDVYNLASGKETTIFRLASLIIKKTGQTAGFEYLPKRAWDTAGKRFGDPSKANRVLKFSAQMELPEGLDATIQWTKNNLALIDACVAKHQSHIPSTPNSKN